MTRRKKPVGYAVRTDVPVNKTRVEIEDLIMKRGAANFATFNETKGAAIAFEMNGRRLVFRLPLPAPNEAQECRSRWRGLLLCIKAKFESIDRGIETFDEAFLAHVMMPDGLSVAEHVSERITLAYSGENIPLLPAPRKSA